MDHVQLIYKSIEYIDEHINQDIKVKELADHVGFSMFHYIRLFNELTRFSPKEYILKRKITEAAKMIVESESSILDVALEYGFNSHETFSRAFKRIQGISPNQVKQGRSLDGIRIYNPIELDFMKFVSKYPHKAPNRIQMDDLTVVGLSNIIRADQLSSFNIKEYQACFDKNHSRLYLLIQEGYNNQMVLFVAHDDLEDERHFRKKFRKSDYAEFNSVGHVSELIHLIHYAYDIWLPSSGVEAKDAKDKLVIVNREGNATRYKLLIPIKSE